MTVEFPNDNPELWATRAPLAALALLLAEAELAADEKAAERSDPNDLPDFSPVTVALAEAPAEEKATERSDPNDLPDSIPVEAQAEVTEPMPPAILAEIEADRSDPNDLAVSEPVAVVVEEDDGPEVEVIEFDEADFAVVENESIPPLPKPDMFEVFARTLVEVALAAGAPGRVVEALPGMLGIARLSTDALDATTIDALVGADMLARSESGAVVRADAFVATAQAWRATILGEDGDFSALTTTLDEWSANLVAMLAGVPQQRESFRRDLRSRGVAAFGLLVEAA